MLEILILMPLIIAAHKSCSWNDENGHIYDLSSLQKSSNYELVDEKNSLGMFTMVYEYNFCSKTVQCNGKEAAAVEALQVMGAVTDNCDILGLATTEIIGYIDPLNQDLGIGITYSDGEMCFELQDDLLKSQVPVDSNNDNMKMVNRAVTFQIKCGTDSGQFQLVDNASCHVIFSKTSPIGCRNYSNSGSNSSKLLLLIIIFGIVYFIGGGYYNSKKTNQSIIQSIPQKEFWLQFPFYVQDGINFTVQYTLQKIRQLQGSGIKGIGGYQTV